MRFEFYLLLVLSYSVLQPMVKTQDFPKFDIRSDYPADDGYLMFARRTPTWQRGKYVQPEDQNKQVDHERYRQFLSFLI